ncbi:MAG: pseudouridine synthase [Gammaproteobacteria bacterium]|nr:MAG: pseudouridine synthase [Gammaproteobacteria bacterium]
MSTKKEKLILFNKPYNVLSQFTDDDGRKTLRDFIDIQGVYPAGRLDKDSEGLLLLTNNGKLQNLIANPQNKKWKTYLVQVDGEITEGAISKLQSGLMLKDGLTKPAKAIKIAEPEFLWKRTPSVRYRANIPTSWVKLSIREGKNRQVRRMTAASGFPTLRLIRYSIDKWSIDGINSGEFLVFDL